jgi:hypothetical protein
MANEKENTAAPEQAKDPFAAFDGMNSEFGNDNSIKDVSEMPKTESNEKGFDNFEKELNGEKKEEKVEEKTLEKAEKTPEGDKKEEKKPDVKAEDKKEEKIDEAKELTEDDKAPELEFDPEKFKFEKAEGETGESSWVDLGKDLGIELKENTFESYKEAVDKIKAEAKEAGKAEAARIELEKFNPEAQKVIEFLNSNPEASIQDFINPLQRIDQALTMDDESLLRADFEAKGWDQDKIDERLGFLSENGHLENEAYGLRKEIENVRAQTEVQLIEDAKAMQAYKQQQFEATQKQENESIINAIKEVKTFMGFKVPDAAKQYIQRQWETGEVRKAFQSSPKDVVEFMLNKYIGQEALKELKKTSFQKGRDEIQSKLHNTKELSASEGSGRREAKDGSKRVGAGAFDAWDNIETDKATVDNNGY